MLFPLLSAAKTLLDQAAEAALSALCVSYRSTEADWQLGRNKALKVVIVRLQLSSHCSPDAGRSPRSGQQR